MVVNKLTEAILNGEVKHGETIYIRPDPSVKEDIILMQVTSEELKALKETEKTELELDKNLIRKTSASQINKVPSSQIVDADIGENGKGKKKKKKKKKDLINETFSLNTQAGD
jgi:hypothetical protein